MEPPPFVFPTTTGQLVAGQNGRVNLATRSSAGGFLENPSAGGFAHRTAVDANPAQDLMRGNWGENELSQKFFGPDNTRTIQEKLKREVYESSEEKQVIDDQSADELQIVLRSIFLQYAKNQGNDIPGQIHDVNDLVLEWCVPRILSEIGM